MANNAVTQYPQPFGATQLQFSNIAITFSSDPATYFPWVGSAEYSDTCEVAEGRGVSPFPIGRTLGEYKASGSIEIFKAYNEKFLENVSRGSPDGNSLYDSEFDVVIQYQLRPPLGQPAPAIITDVMKGCCITGQSLSLSAGNSVIMVKYTLYVSVIQWNGRYPLAGLPK